VIVFKLCFEKKIQEKNVIGAVLKKDVCTTSA